MKYTCMKIVLAAVVVAGMGLAMPAQGETILIDLGNDGSYNGATVANPDANGNYWNSVGYAYQPGLVDTDGNATAVAYAPIPGYGTDNYNGPAFASEPVAALGILGGSVNALNDYFVNGSLEIQGLDPLKTYNLTFYGSHKFDTEPYDPVTEGISTYEIHTDNSYSSVVDSTVLYNNEEQISGWRWEPNVDRTATISGVAPQASNILYVKYDGYVNAIALEAVPEPATFGLLGLAGAGLLVMRRMRRG